MIGFLVQGRARIKIRIRVRIGVTFNINIYHWSNCRRSKCCTFINSLVLENYFVIYQVFCYLSLSLYWVSTVCSCSKTILHFTNAVKYMRSVQYSANTHFCENWVYTASTQPLSINQQAVKIFSLNSASEFGNMNIGSFISESAAHSITSKWIFIQYMNVYSLIIPWLIFMVPCNILVIMRLYCINWHFSSFSL